LVRLLFEASGETVWNQITAHLKNGKSILSLGDAIQIGASELILRTTVARQFTDGQHPFDYCNTANYWLRRTASPYQARILYLMANFVNDSARSNKLHTSIFEEERKGLDASRRTAEALLVELDEAIMALDAPRTTALAAAYLESGADRSAYMSTVALAACKFQDDPHNQKISHSAFEEYAHNSTHRRGTLCHRPGTPVAGWAATAGERQSVD